MSHCRFALQKLKIGGGGGRGVAAHKFANKRPEQSKQNAHGQKRPGAAAGGRGGAGQLAHLNIDMIPILFANIVEGGVELRGSGGRPYSSSHN